METGRTVASAIMWITYLAIVGLSIAALGAWVILLAFVLMMPLLAAMGIMWSKEDVRVKSSKRGFIFETGSTEKRKGIPLDSVLNDFDNDDLRMLRDHLIYGTDEEIIYDYSIDDDDLLIEKH